MEKLRNFISFSSYIEDKKYYTAIDLVLNLIKVHEDGELVYEGTIEGFKELEKIKAKNTDKVYSDLLRMANELIDILTKA